MHRKNREGHSKLGKAVPFWGEPTDKLGKSIGNLDVVIRTVGLRP